MFQSKRENFNDTNRAFLITSEDLLVINNDYYVYWDCHCYEM